EGRPRFITSTATTGAKRGTGHAWAVCPTTNSYISKRARAKLGKNYECGATLHETPVAASPLLGRDSAFIVQPAARKKRHPTRPDAPYPALVDLNQWLRLLSKALIGLRREAAATAHPEGSPYLRCRGGKVH